MVAHEAVGVIAAVTATSVAFVIVPNAHPVEGVDELVVVFLVLKDGLMINTTHHHMVYTGSRRCSRLAGHTFSFTFPLSSTMLRKVIPNGRTHKSIVPCHVYLTLFI